MEYLYALLKYLCKAGEMVHDHLFLTFTLIVLLGCVWIYFQIPHIKAETTPKVKATKEEWKAAEEGTLRNGVCLLVAGISLSTLLWLLKPGDAMEVTYPFVKEIVFTFEVAISLSFAGAMFFLGQKKTTFTKHQ